MKPNKQVNSGNIWKDEIIPGLIFCLILAHIMLFAFAASAQTTDNITQPHKAIIVANTDKGAVIKWNAAADSKYTFFLIERSKDKVHYEIVSVVKNTGSINTTNFYTGTDYNPLEGTTYYRVSETNFKGNQVHLFEVKFSSSQSLTQN